MYVLRVSVPRPAVVHGRCKRPVARSRVTCRVTPNTSQELRPVHVSVPNDDTGGRLELDVLATPGSRVFTAAVKKPLGLVLAEKGGRIVVESVSSGGHAAGEGIAAGDVLLATGARAQVESGRTAPVLLPTAGESFATVAAAIRSNTCSQCAVHLVLERPPAVNDS